MAREPMKIAVQLETEEVEEGLDKIAEKAEETGKKTKEGSKGMLEGFSALGDLFMNLLPRGMQKTVRQLKMTRRGVDRASRSFNILKKAATPAIFTALLFALEYLIENFEKVTDFLGFTSQEMRNNEEATENATKAVNQYNATTMASIAVLNDLNKSEEARQFALDRLKKSVEGINDVELDNADALERVNAAYERQQELTSLQSQIQTRQKQLEAELTAAEEARTTGLDFLMSAKGREAEEERRYNEYVEENVLPLQKELEELQIKEAERRKEITAQIEAERKAIEEANAAEKEAEQAKRLAEQNAVKREELNEKLAQQETLRALEGEELLRKQNEYALEAELERAKEFGASKEVLLRIEKQYQLDLDESLTNFREQQAAQDEADRERKRDESLREQESMMSAIAALEKAERDNRMALEGDDTAIAIQRVKDKYASLIAQAEKYNYDTTELERLRTEEIQKINQDADAKLQVTREAGMKVLEDGARNMMRGISSIAEEGSATQKSLAVMEILLNQGKAMAAAIAGATQAAAATGPGAPFALAGYIASMIGTVVGSFAQIKNILQEADAAGGGFGGGSRGGRIGSGGVTATLVPDVPMGSPQSRMNVSAYVVQSELQGMRQFESNVKTRTSL